MLTAQVLAGQMNKSAAAHRILAVLWALAIVVVVSGCGGKDEPEPATPAHSQAMVPATADTAVTDSTTAATAAAAGQTSGTSAGDGVQTPANEENATIKATPTDTGEAEAARVNNPFHRPQVETGDGDFSLQLGSYRDAANAEAQVQRISALGYSPMVEVASLGGQTYHRVVVRGLADRNEAEKLGEHIRAELGLTYLIRQK